MKKINLLYGNDTSDVDILCVPNHIADNIENITQQFFNWMGDINNVHNYRRTNEMGEPYLEIDTEAFVWWLNNYYPHVDEIVAIFEQHVDFCPDYPTAEF